MKESISTSQTSAAGDALDVRVTAAVEKYGHLTEFAPLMELILELCEELERAKDSGQQ